MMTTCAVVDENNIVVNVIIAEPTDPAPIGCQLIVSPDSYGDYADIGDIWQDNRFIHPNPITE